MARCPECEGRKRVEVGLVMTKPCPRCHGTGEVEDAELELWRDDPWDDTRSEGAREAE